MVSHSYRSHTETRVPNLHKKGCCSRSWSTSRSGRVPTRDSACSGGLGVAPSPSGRPPGPAVPSSQLPSLSTPCRNPSSPPTGLESGGRDKMAREREEESMTQRASRAFDWGTEEWEKAGRRALDLAITVSTGWEGRAPAPIASPEEVRRRFQEPCLYRRPLRGGRRAAGGRRGALDLHRTSPMARLHTSSPAPVGMLADLVVSAVNPNLGLLRGGPAGTAIELQSIDWLKELLGYPPEAEGVYSSGGAVRQRPCARRDARPNGRVGCPHGRHERRAAPPSICERGAPLLPPAGRRAARDGAGSSAASPHRLGLPDATRSRRCASSPAPRGCGSTSTAPMGIRRDRPERAPGAPRHGRGRLDRLRPAEVALCSDRRWGHARARATVHTFARLIPTHLLARR